MSTLPCVRGVRIMDGFVILYGSKYRDDFVAKYLKTKNKERQTDYEEFTKTFNTWIRLLMECSLALNLLASKKDK
jgi:hypothetical protein